MFIKIRTPTYTLNGDKIKHFSGLFFTYFHTVTVAEHSANKICWLSWLGLCLSFVWRSFLFGKIDPGWLILGIPLSVGGLLGDLSKKVHSNCGGLLVSDHTVVYISITVLLSSKH